MYAVIRAGGKQYRVTPGDVIRVEKLAPGAEENVEFNDVVAVSASEGQISKPQSDVHVRGQVVEQGRHDKVLVFHYKRKKQYKKLRGHRQPFTAVRITEIAMDGQTFTAPPPDPDIEEKPRPTPPAAQETEPESPSGGAKVQEAKVRGKIEKPRAKKAVAKKTTAKTGGRKKKK